MVAEILETPTLSTQAQTLKGWGFVLVTSIALYAVLLHAARSLQKSYSLLETILESTTDAIFAKNLDGQYVVANTAAADLAGVSVPQMLGANDIDLFGEKLGRQFQDHDRMTTVSGITQQVENWLTPPNPLPNQPAQVPKIYLTCKDVWYDPRGVPIGVIGISRDMTDAKQAYEALAESEERYRNLFECHPQPMWIYDQESLRFLAVNQAAIAHYGYSHDEFMAMTIEAIRPAEDVPSLLDNLQHIPRGYTASGIRRHLKKDGSVIAVDITTHDFTFKGRPAQVILANDVTERLQVQAQLERYAFRDTVTGLLNRTGFSRNLQQAISRNRKQAHPFTLLYVSLDGFTRLKFSLGHAVARQLLVEAAVRIKTCFPKAIAGRMEDNEFAILLRQNVDSIEAIVGRLREHLTSVYGLNHHDVFSDCSIGVVVSDLGYPNPEDYLQAGDMAMYQARSTLPDKYVMFSQKLRDAALNRIELDAALRRALERDEFEVYYQPFIHLSTSHCLGFEALVRWQHPQRGLVPPGEFIPLTEETGLVVALGEWVLRQACQQLARWQTQLKQPDLTMSVNVAAVQLTQPGFLEVLDDILRTTAIPAYCLKLEITETTLMQNTEQIRGCLDQIQQRGITLSIDDFGTGYSSLSYLHLFSFTVLKLDRSFVMQLEASDRSIEIVRNIARLAQNLHLSLVAEGIETQHQLAALQELGFEEGQGYLFSRPLNSQSAEQWLLDRI
ncbi:MAG: EAL domain-containing protein [Sodalinema sp.]|uniref:sensor domain-containing protein n=1 Tax=Sodalinema sp. TaxID=3080550 RepID=UPI0011FCDE4A|nr:MAG: bifunctional diguanylate cyclase/phosphodiesterase [Phormidium sp. SL48-SHIP]